ncbi:aminotransferase class I/II-fold pyridoxal phosphate-dependent enzyme [Chloroflexi bacterium TSY]|nr:aminotransferase class I/II-fold pyridoxal phosphate-dependent enzyme [Chloroflexi bacterium TSY]
MTPEEFRTAGHQLIDWVADFRTGIRSRPVMAQVEPGHVKAQLPNTPPEEPESFAQILRDLEEIIVPGLSHFQHPSFFGYFPANSLLSSVLGDYLSTGLGSLGLSWQSAPALTELEEAMTDWMRQMVGLSADWNGVIQDTASTTTLLALICARERTTNFGMVHGGLQAETKPLIVYVSEYSHSSVDKAALLAGFGRENVRLIDVDDAFALDPSSLERAIQEDLAEGKQPCAIVATTGTTTSTALDPIESLAEIAQRYNLWLHVDSALAGSAMILPECRWMWEGIERADSVVLNPHKWLGAAFDCTLCYVRDSEHLVRVMGTNPSYLQSAADNEVKNYRDWGIPLGRRFRALKLWTLIREQGVTGLQQRVRRDIANAQWLEARVKERPEWSVLAPVPLQTVCIRHEPSNLSNEELDPVDPNLAFLTIFSRERRDFGAIFSDLSCQKQPISYLEIA